MTLCANFGTIKEILCVSLYPQNMNTTTDQFDIVDGLFEAPAMPDVTNKRLLSAPLCAALATINKSFWSFF